MTDVTTDDLTLDDDGPLAALADPPTPIPGQEALVPMSKKEKAAAEAAADAAAAAAAAAPNDTREYVCLERIDARGLLTEAMVGMSLDAEDQRVLLDALPAVATYVQLHRGPARNPEAMLKMLADELARPAIVVCPPASKFQEKLVRYKQPPPIIEVVDRPAE